MSRKTKKHIYVMTAVMLSFFVLSIMCPEVAWAKEAAKKEVIGKFESFETLFADIVSILGTIYTLWGVSEWGLAWHESNGTMGGQSFKRIFGGLVVVLSPQILAILA